MCVLGGGGGSGMDGLFENTYHTLSKKIKN